MKKCKYDVEECCANCELSTETENSENFICSKKGSVKPENHCRHYRFDLLKIKPHRIKLDIFKDN